VSRLVVVTVAPGPAGAEGRPLVPAAGARQDLRARQAAGGPLAYGSVLPGSGCGYRDRDRRDPASALAMDWSLPSSGISSSPAR
jgi:hypothetical protein